MAPQDFREDLKAVAGEMEDEHHVVEKLIDYDPTLANAADTQQLGTMKSC